MTSKTSERKLDHIKICLEREVESKFKTTGFEDIDLLHEASPNMDLDQIDISTSIFGKKIEAPIIISPLTGGHKRGQQINLELAKAARELDIGMSVGSQRAAIESSKLEKTYQVRKVAPNILLFGNLGVPQINMGYGLDELKKAVEMIDADALGLHFNSLQESVQPEGDTKFDNVIEKIKSLSPQLNRPIYAKETGAGINSAIARKLVSAGVKAIDVSGAGGTSWARVETIRKGSNTRLGETFRDWGIPTAVCTADVAEKIDIPVISSGGIRTGIEAAKAISLGADLVGMGLPLFKVAVKGKDAIVEWLEEFIQEVKIAMFLTGSENLRELQNTRLIVTGKTGEWFTSLGLNPEE